MSITWYALVGLFGHCYVLAVIPFLDKVPSYSGIAVRPYDSSGHDSVRYFRKWLCNLLDEEHELCKRFWKKERSVSDKMPTAYCRTCVLNKVIENMKNLLPDKEQKTQLQKQLQPNGSTTWTAGEGRSADYTYTFVPRKRWSSSYSRNSFFYGSADRSLVARPLMRKYPYANVVRLSSGCTGTLLTPYHVLTAAHCVHDGEDFKNNLEMLKIEVPSYMGFRMYYIEKISIPTKWLRSNSLPQIVRESFDYAVVKLSIRVAGRSHFMPLSVPKTNILTDTMYFLGFMSHNIVANLWTSECAPHSNMAMMDGNLILTRCDSAIGFSGAAVFTDDSREGKSIVGIISNTRSVSTGFSLIARYSIITALTWDKLYEVCSMMAPLGQFYGVCPEFHHIPRTTKMPLGNRVIPFFG